MSFSFGLPFLPYYIQDLGVVDPEKVRLFTGILSAAPAIGMGIMASIWGMLADRVGKKTNVAQGNAFSFSNSYLYWSCQLNNRCPYIQNSTGFSYRYCNCGLSINSHRNTAKKTWPMLLGLSHHQHLLAELSDRLLAGFLLNRLATNQVFIQVGLLCWYAFSQFCFLLKKQKQLS